MDIGHKQKKLIIFANDFILALICWLVFGPPMATVIASEFSSGVFEILFGEWQSFVIPTLLAQTYLYIFGFYKTIIKFLIPRIQFLLPQLVPLFLVLAGR